MTETNTGLRYQIAKRVVRPTIGERGDFVSVFKLDY